MYKTDDLFSSGDGVKSCVVILWYSDELLDGYVFHYYESMLVLLLYAVWSSWRIHYHV